MFSYSLWGADVISDVQLDLDNDADLKRKLIELKVKIDMHGSVTGKFVIKDNKAYAFVFEDMMDDWKKSFADKGLKAPAHYMGELASDVKNFIPVAVYGKVGS